MMTGREIKLMEKIENVLGCNVEGMRFVEIMEKLVEVIENGRAD